MDLWAGVRLCERCSAPLQPATDRLARRTRLATELVEKFNRHEVQPDRDEPSAIRYQPGTSTQPRVVGPPPRDQDFVEMGRRLGISPEQARLAMHHAMQASVSERPSLRSSLAAALAARSDAEDDE